MLSDFPNKKKSLRIIRGSAINTLLDGDGMAKTDLQAEAKPQGVDRLGRLLPRLLRLVDIRYRLIVSFILVALVPLLVCGVTSYVLAGEVHALRNKIIVIGLICTVFILLVSYAICRSVSVPLSRLVCTMKKTEGGNYRLQLQCEGRDELTVLSLKFNEMADIVQRHHEQLDALVAARTKALRDANLELEALSATDVLTGLANRRRLDEVLASELRRAIRSSKPLALIMLDVDFFKKYNDHYGHQAGDVCLRQVADALQAGCHRGGDLVARYGGEEFVLVAADTDMAGSLMVAEMLRASVEAMRLPHCDSPFGQVTVSIGVAALQPMAMHTPDMLLRMADQAMYRAKLLGRNRVVAMEQELVDD
jgi:diguanylate cyclase (GGDEF)-like protein